MLSGVPSPSKSITLSNELVWTSAFFASFVASERFFLVFSRFSFACSNALASFPFHAFAYSSSALLYCFWAFVKSACISDCFCKLSAYWFVTASCTAFFFKLRTYSSMDCVTSPRDCFTPSLFWMNPSAVTEYSVPIASFNWFKIEPASCSQPSFTLPVSSNASDNFPFRRSNGAAELSADLFVLSIELDKLSNSFRFFSIEALKLSISFWNATCSLLASFDLSAR